MNGSIPKRDMYTAVYKACWQLEGTGAGRDQKIARALVFLGVDKTTAKNYSLAVISDGPSVSEGVCRVLRSLQK